MRISTSRWLQILTGPFVAIGSVIALMWARFKNGHEIDGSSSLGEDLDD